MADYFKFQWEVDVGGYEIATNRTDEWRELRGRTGQRRKYDPFALGSDGRVLFHILADTKQTPNGYLDFANRFGLLNHSAEPEPLDVWYIAIGSMAVVVENWHEGEWDALEDAYRHHDFAQVSVHLDREPNALRPTLHVSPASLIDALWIQLAEALSSDLKIRKCLRCFKPFPFGTGTARRNTAIYCSPKCQKSHAYAKRQETIK